MNQETLTLLDILTKGTAVLFFSLGGIAFLRRYSAAQRSLAWLAVFGTLLILPLAGFVHPFWTVPVTIVKAQLPLDNFTPSPEVPLDASSEINTSLNSAQSVAPAWISWQWPGVIYISGVIALLAFRLVGSAQLRCLKRETSKPNVRILSLIRELELRHRIRRHIDVLLSDHITVPMTWGTLNPVLLLPTDSEEWSSDDLQAAIEHELAHIRHFDAVRRWLATLVTALWWPHPLVWIASKAWRLEQERACDDAVVRSGANAECYARQLLHAARTLHSGSFQSAAALVMAMPSGLETRLRSVMEPHLNRSATGKVAFLITAIASLGFIMICTVCQARTDAPAKTIPTMIKITTRFLELTLENPATKHPVLQKALGGAPVVLDDTEMQELWRQLSQKKGVNLLSAPVVTTRSGQKATIEVVREFIYPIAFEQESDKPTKFDMTPVGVIVNIEPVMEKKGTIRLNPVEAIANEFLGYMARGKLHPLPKDKDSSIVDRSMGNISEKLADLSKELPTDGREKQPVFSTQKWSGDVSLKQGQCLVSYLKYTDERDKDNRGIWFFVSATEVLIEKSK